MRDQAAFGTDTRNEFRGCDPGAPGFTLMPNEKHWSRTIGDDVFRGAIKRSNADLIPRPLSIYLHLPFCATLCYHCNRHKKVTRNRSMIAAYVDTLVREMTGKAVLFDRDRMVRSLRVGGGTPVYLKPGQISHLMANLRTNFSMPRDGDRDYAIDIDPRSVTTRDLQNLAWHGFNRVQLAVQGMSRVTELAINRAQSDHQVRFAIAKSRDAGIDEVGVLFRYGLPAQTLQLAERSLSQLLTTGPASVRLAAYCHDPAHNPAQRLVPETLLPAADVRNAMFIALRDRLIDAGYQFLGPDQFALPNSALFNAQRTGSLARHIGGFSSNAGHDMLGLGLAAVSRIDEHLFQNATEIDRYSEAIADGGSAIVKGRLADDQERAQSQVVQDLLCQGRCDKSAWEDSFKQPFDQYFKAALDRLNDYARAGAIALEPQHIVILPPGMTYLDRIIGCFQSTK